VVPALYFLLFRPLMSKIAAENGAKTRYGERNAARHAAS
jgi:hypothetical protein